MPDNAQDLRAAAARAVSETGAHQLIAAHLARFYGWTCSQRAASCRLSQMLSPSDRHQLPADALAIIVRVTGRDPFTELLAEAKYDFKRMAKVELDEGRGRRRVG